MFDHERIPVKPSDEPGPAVDPAVTDPVELSDDELDSQTQALWAHVHVAMGRAVALQAEINRRGLWGTWGARSPGQWLSWRAGLSGTEANRLCAVADRIDDCPGTKKALTAGELSLAKAAAITRVATDATEDTLLHYARHAPTPELEAIARAYRKVTGSGDDTDRHRRRYLTTFFDEHSDYIIKGRLTPDAGAVVEKALGVAHDRIPWDPEADVLKPGLCEVEPGAEIAPETARRIACDAALVEMIERDGMPPVPGRKSRIVPTRLRRALTARDRSCRFPGCTARGHYDAHHIVFWGDGGPTVLDNLVLLCRFHHRVVHEDGFSIVASGSEFKFLSPDGWEIPAVPESSPATGDIGTAVSALGVDVDVNPERILPAQLVGETDVALCVDYLLSDDAEAAEQKSAATPSEARASP
jgi:hypothetical protein